MSYAEVSWRNSGPRVLIRIALAVLCGSLAFAAIAQSPAKSAPNPNPAPPNPPEAKVGTDRPAEIPEKPAVPVDPETLRQKQLADDTAKLLALANELKAELEKSTKDTLSLSVIKKADEIEKLAKKVRSEMKETIGN